MGQVLQFRPKIPAPIEVVPPEPVTVPERPSEDEWVTWWLSNLRNPNTRRNYATDIRFAREWLKEQSGFKVDLYAARSHHWSDYFSYELDTLELEPNSVRRHRTAAMALYKYAVNDEDFRMTGNPVANTQPIKGGSYVQYIGLSLVEVERLVVHALHHPDSLVRSVISVLLTTGLRVGELRGADVEGLKWEHERWRLHVVRKGGKQDVVDIPEEVYEMLRPCVAGRREGPLLLGARGGRVPYCTLWQLVRDAGNASLPDKQGKLHPHDLRHTSISLVYLATSDMARTQRHGAHADPRVTAGYVHALEELEAPTSGLVATMLGLRTGT